MNLKVWINHLWLLLIHASIYFDNNSIIFIWKIYYFCSVNTANFLWLMFNFIKAWPTVVLTDALHAPVPLMIFWSNYNFNEICNAVVHYVLRQSQWSFVQVRKVTLPLCVQNSIVIGSAHLKTKYSKFWSNFEFDWNIINGMDSFIYWCAHPVYVFEINTMDRLQVRVNVQNCYV